MQKYNDLLGFRQVILFLPRRSSHRLFLQSCPCQSPWSTIPSLQLQRLQWKMGHISSPARSIPASKRGHRKQIRMWSFTSHHVYSLERRPYLQSIFHIWSSFVGCHQVLVSIARGTDKLTWPFLVAKHQLLNLLFISIEKMSSKPFMPQCTWIGLYAPRSMFSPREIPVLLPRSMSFPMLFRRANELLSYMALVISSWLVKGE